MAQDIAGIIAGLKNKYSGEELERKLKALKTFHEEFPNMRPGIVGTLESSQAAADNMTPRRRTSNPTHQEGGGGGQLRDLTREYLQPGGCKSLVDVLDEDINTLIENSKDSNWAPFLFLLQSMGYGKTRAMLELAEKKRRTVYLPCKDIPSYGGSGEGWKVPETLKNLLGQLNYERDENICEYKWIQFLTALKKIAAVHERADDLFRAQISTEGELSAGFYEHTDLEPSPKKSTSTPPSAIRRGSNKRKRGGNVSFDEHGINGAEIVYDDAAKVDKHSLVVCVDEATALSEASFRALRRAAKFLGIILIFSDTSASISRIMPANDASSTHQGGQLGHFTPPIYKIPNFDLEWKFREADDDIANLFRAGRPRWASLLQTITERTSSSTTEENLQTLVSHVQTLLSRDGRINEADRSSLLNTADERKRIHSIPSILPNMVAIFSCRFSLGSNSKIAPLLAKYSLATVLEVSEKRDVVSTHYPSEPVLAEASAQYTRDATKLMEVLNHVHAAVMCQHLQAPRGDVGEMCAAALLGFTMDMLRKGAHLFSGVSVDLKSFLSIFGCHDSYAVKTALAGWKVNFTHFVRPAEDLDDKDVEIMWKRRMAYYVPKGMKGLDLLIAIHHQTKGYATLRVQVKNHASNFKKSSRMVALDKLAPCYCPPKMPDEVFSVGLLLCVNSVDRHCALVDYQNVRHSVDPPQRHSNRKNSKYPDKLFLQLASSFPEEGDSFNGFSPTQEYYNVCKKLKSICSDFQNTEEEWDVSSRSILDCKKLLNGETAQKVVR